MGNESARITDKALIFETLKKRFISGKIFIRTREINVQAESFDVADGFVTVAKPEADGAVDSVIFYVRDGENVILSHAVLKSSDESGNLLYEPVDLQIMKIPRREERKNVADVNTDGKKSVNISDIISDFIIHDSLELSMRRVDLIRDELMKKISSVYSDSEIVFINEKSNDPRMLFFKKMRRPYFIREIDNIENPDSVRNDPDLKYYKEYIYPRETLLHRTKISSEITVPLLYRMMLPFGYVRATGFRNFTDEDYSALRKFGMSASTVFSNDKQLIRSSNDIIPVTDLSMSGLGVFFKEKVLIKHFKEGSLLIFNIYLPEKKQATVLCEVRNIALIKNYIYRVGCEIHNIDPIGEVNYSEYLESVGKAN